MFIYNPKSLSVILLRRFSINNFVLCIDKHKFDFLIRSCYTSLLCAMVERYPLVVLRDCLVIKRILFFSCKSKRLISLVIKVTWTNNRLFLGSYNLI